MESNKLVVGIVSRNYIKIVNEELGTWAFIKGLTAQEYLDARTRQTDMFDISASADGQVKFNPKKTLTHSMADYVILYGMKKPGPTGDIVWNLTDATGKTLEPSLGNITELYEDIHTWLFKAINDLSKLSKSESKNLKEPSLSSMAT